MVRNIDKNDKLSNLIKKLSTQNISDSSSTDEFFTEFKEIYSDNFRHLYSMLFSIIVENSEEENGSLVENMGIIYNKLKDCDNEDDEGLKKSIFKLYDHINLDVSRVTYFLSTYKKNEIDKNNLTEKLQKEAGKLQKIKRQTQSMQKEYIAILGIFSAIVITFVAGLVFTSSILQNIEKASVYRLVLITWLLGFMLTEVLYSLFLFIEIITNKMKTSNNNTAKK